LSSQSVVLAVVDLLIFRFSLRLFSRERVMSWGS